MKGQLSQLGITYEAKEKADKEIEAGKKATDDKAGQLRDAIYFFGPTTKVFKFTVRTRSWSMIKVDKQCTYRGNIKH